MDPRGRVLTVLRRLRGDLVKLPGAYSSWIGRKGMNRGLGDSWGVS